MEFNTKIKLAAAIWIIPLLISMVFYGIFGGLTNVFRWWSVWITGLEFFAAVVSNPQAILELFLLPITELKIRIFMGAPLVLAWATTLGILIKDKRSKENLTEILLVFSSIPILALFGVYRIVKSEE